MNELTQQGKGFKSFLVIAIFVLGSITLFGFIYLATTPATTLTMLLSFAGGVSNIVLPCTLPLVFIIVPIAMGTSGKKGLIMAALFGIGLIITLSVYGSAVAQIGKFVGLDSATRIMYAAAGIAAFVFGLSELKLIKFKMPTYSGMPQFIQKRGDYTKVFLLGLLLGNAGVGCPNPVTYIILIFSASTGDWLQGGLLMAINGVGRVVPLLLLSALGILGINATGGLTKRIETVRKFTGWALVILGSFIILNGAFGHLWYEGGVFHEGLNLAFMASGGKMIGEADVPIEEVEGKVPFMEYGALVNLIVSVVPVFWHWRKYPQERKQVLKILAIVLVWSALLFNIGLDSMEILGLSEGLPEEMGAMEGMK
ncbi:MAG: cytochrome c biogenesis protein CcdA [Thermoproteota archaeon]|jgi:cytochrome c-type biogenesis protein